MIPSFHCSDAGRSIYAPAEKNDCTVRAVAAAFGVPYPEAHNRLALLGRQPRQGMHFGVYAERLGLLAREELSWIRLHEVMPKLDPAKCFIITTATHAFAVVRGTIWDSLLPKATTKTMMVYEVPIL